jgi:hypothetical protein
LKASHSNNSLSIECRTERYSTFFIAIISSLSVISGVVQRRDYSYVYSISADGDSLLTILIACRGIVSVADPLFQEYFPSDAVQSWFSSASITDLQAQQNYVQSIVLAGSSGLTAVPTDLRYQFIAYESTVLAILQGT